MTGQLFVNFSVRDSLVPLIWQSFRRNRLPKSLKDSDLHKMEDALSFRLATPQDFEEVKALSKGIYNGFDYLPEVYHHWLKQSNIAVMVAVIEGKIIGLEAQIIVDDGKTTVTRAKRIHPDYRGRRYGTRLDEAVRNHVRMIFPSIRRERLAKAVERDATGNFKELLVLHTLSCHIDKSTFKLGNLPRADRQLTSCNPKQFADVILSRPVAKNIFPNDTHVIDWMPFEATRSNTNYMLEDGDELFVEEYSGENSPMSFSHGRFTPTEQFQIWCCTIYAQDAELFKAHLIEQVASASRIIQGSFIFLSFQSESMAKLGKELLFDQSKLRECQLPKNLHGKVEKIFVYEETSET